MNGRFAACTGLLVAGIVMAIPVKAASDTPPSPRPGEVKADRPPAVAPSTKPGPIAVARPPSMSGDSADAGRWKGARAVKISASEADVRLTDGSSLHLRPGDRVGADVVERIEPGRILLARRAPDVSGAVTKVATVVVSFDDAGLGRTRVYWLRDPQAIAPPTVK